MPISYGEKNNLPYYIFQSPEAVEHLTHPTNVLPIVSLALAPLHVPAQVICVTLLDRPRSLWLPFLLQSPCPCLFSRTKIV